MGSEHEADKLMRGLLQQLSPVDRLRMCARMFHTAKVLAVSGILSESEPTDADGLGRALFLRFYGRDFSEAQLEEILTQLRLSRRS